MYWELSGRKQGVSKMKLLLVRWVVNVLVFTCAFANEELDKKAEELRESQKKLHGTRSKINFESYRSGFKIKRSHQMAAVKSIQYQIKNYEKQYLMVEKVLEKMFTIIEQSKTTLTEAGYTPGAPFPIEQKEKEALAHVLENTALFGDMLLRLPDITHQIYKKSKQNQLVVKWCMSICNASGIYDKTGQKLLSLVAQELNLVPKDSNYVNPYKIENQMDQELERDRARAKSQSTKDKKRERKKRKRGPRLSDEL